jgi:hypothetical protein
MLRTSGITEIVILVPEWLFIQESIAEQTKRFTGPHRRHAQEEEGERTMQETTGELCHSISRSLLLASMDDFRDCQEVRELYYLSLV